MAADELGELAAIFDSVTAELKPVGDLFVFPGLEETVNNKANRDMAAKHIREAA